MKASRNRTIEIGEEERPILRRGIVSADDVTRGFDFADKTINGDMGAVLPLMPDVPRPYSVCLVRIWYGKCRSKEIGASLLRHRDKRGVLSVCRQAFASG